MASILITGGTGLVAKHLSKLLIERGHTISYLSRQKRTTPNWFYWNLNTNFIEEKAILEANYIIHLAGENIAKKRWTRKRKKELFNSRVQSTNLLFQKVKTLNPNLKGFIAASGIGYYGTITSNKIYTEKDESGKDFLSYVCKFWEMASLQFKTTHTRTVIFRTGVVFAKNGGALKKIVKPIKLGFGAVLGRGNQYIPWIHIEDLCRLYIEAIENKKFNGIYNAVAPEYVTNTELTFAVARAINKTIWLPNIPNFIIRLLFGEMAVILLAGNKISAENIIGTGFNFKFSTFKKAFQNIMNQQAF